MKKLFALLILTLGISEINSMNVLQKVMAMALTPELFTYTGFHVGFKSAEKRQYYLEHINVPDQFHNQSFSETLMPSGETWYYIKWDINNLTYDTINQLLETAESAQKDDIIANDAMHFTQGHSRPSH